MMKKPVWIVLITVFILCDAGFLYTFLQPRYSAVIVSVGRAQSVTTHTGHRSRSHTVVPVVVRYMDSSGANQTVEVNLSRPDSPISVGQEIVIVESFNGFTIYPFTGLRLFCGSVAGALGVFFLLMWMDRKKSPPDISNAQEGR